MASSKGKVVLVTGASSGIGAEICREFAKHGMVVIGAARREDRLMELSDEVNRQGGGEFHSYRCDLSKESEIMDLFQRIEQQFGKLDVYVNNAGVAKPGPVLHSNSNFWREMLDLNVYATGICLRESVRIMRKSGNIDGQHVIVIGSTLGHKVSLAPVMHLYSATKFAVRALADGLRQELLGEKSKIRVTHIAPGPVRTEASQQMFPEIPNINDMLYVNYNPLDVKDIAAAALYALQSPPNVSISEICLSPIEDLDRHLSWEKQYSDVKRKTNYGIQMINRVKDGLPLTEPLMLCHCFVESALDYCAPVWSDAGETLRDGIEIAQRKALRVIGDLPFIANVNQKFEEWGVEKARSRWRRQEATWLYRIVNHEKIVISEYIVGLVKFRTDARYDIRH